MRCKFAAALVLALALSATASHANWLSKLTRSADHLPSGRTAKGATALEHAGAHVASLPGKGPALAAEISGEGHWTFINRAGERFTAANADEMKRVLPTLSPEAAKSESKLTVYLTEDSLFRDRTRLKELPLAADVRVISGSSSHRVLSAGDGTAARVLVEHRPNLLIEAADATRYAEAAFQMNRSVGQSRMRVLSIDPQGPTKLTTGPRLDPASGRALIDPIQPDHLVNAIGTLRGQTAVLVARRDGDVLVFKPASGVERRVPWAELAANAERWDVNLLIIRASTPNQPGARNWLWQKVGVKGLDDAVTSATLADVTAALLPRNTPFVATATPRGLHQTTIDITPARDVPATASTATQMGDKVIDLMSEMTGQVINAGLYGAFTSRERQRELDDRIIPGIPAGIQWSYIVAVMLGMFGAPIARGWWQRIWPSEARDEYDGSVGYWAARVTRGISFWAIFAPLVALVSAPLQVMAKLWELLTAPVRFLRWLRARSTA